MLKETTLEELKIIAQGEVISTIGFVPGQTFNVRVKKLVLENFLVAGAKGNIPNKLLDRADEIFENAERNAKGEKKLTKKELKEITELEDHILRAIMVKPTFDEVKESGLELSVLQRQDILSYGFSNVDSLETFRNE